MSWLLLSTRWRGTLLVAPSCAHPETRRMGRPESAAPPLHCAVVAAAHSPMELGWKLWSCGKNPSAKRFQP